MPALQATMDSEKPSTSYTAFHRAYYQRNKEAKAEYYERNKEAILAKARERYQAKKLGDKN